MAKKEYNSTIADYIKLKFKCNCGETIETKLIPVLSRYDNNKNINQFSYDKPIICPNCKQNHGISFYDDMYSSFVDIPTIKEDCSIIFLHEIPLEYAEIYDNALIDYIGELGKVRNFLDAINDLYTNTNILYKMSLIYAISMMDAYLGNTFRHNVKKINAFKQQYEENRKHYKNRCRPLNAIENQSFQNLHVARPYYKLAFNIDIPEYQSIQNAVHIRNTIIHNNSREKDGYENIVNLHMVKELINDIQNLVHFVNNKMIDAVCDKVIN